MTQFAQTQQPAPILPNLLEKVFTPPMIAACGFLALLIVLGPILNSLHHNQKITSGKWAKESERNNARKLGLEQLKAQQVKEVALYIGDPTDSKCLWLPNANSGIAILGATGKGKSHSAYNPLLRSAMEQGHAIELFDASGELAEIHVPQALELGYSVHFFAPGEEYSGVLNLLDFVRDETDSEGAEELGHILRTNNAEHNSKGDSFFGPATDATSKSAILMAKNSPYPDLPMAFSLLGVPDFAQRLKDADDIDLWAKVAATTALSTADSPRTVASIVAGVINMYQTLITARNIPCITGRSTIPLDLPPKHMVVFQYDQERQAACAPLVAAAIHMLTQRNIGPNAKYKVPLFLGLDEFATSLYLPKIAYWTNFARKYGLICALGIQSKSQLISLYGNDIANALMTGLTTKLMFNPNDINAAEELSKMLGEQEILLRRKSTSFSRDGRSRSTSEDLQKKALLSATEINRIPRGGAVFISPGFANKKEAGLPLLVEEIKVPQEQVDRNIAAQQRWCQVQRAEYTERVKEVKQILQPLSPADALQTRKSAAELILPPAMPQIALNLP